MVRISLHDHKRATRDYARQWIVDIMLAGHAVFISRGGSRLPFRQSRYDRRDPEALVPTQRPANGSRPRSTTQPQPGANPARART